MTLLQGMSIAVILLSILNYTNSQAEITVLDSPRNILTLRSLRGFLFKFIGTNSDDDRKFRINLKKGKLQKQFSTNTKFLCDDNGMRSASVPTSVHELRPGDIDIVGAIGDSLTAGNGAMATNIIEILNENKGISFSIGGQYTWRKFLTIPNILKVFNPNLYGYAEQDGISTQRSSMFNAAEIGAMSQDVPHMAKNLVKRMLSDAKVDMQNHWKLVTILIGPNDFCSNMCFHKYPEEILDFHEKNLLSALRTFKKYLPRTMVNVLATPSVEILTTFKGRPNECISIHYIECPCMFGSKFANQRKRYSKIMKKWNALQEEVVNREEFHNTNDFVVNYQTFLMELKFPRTDYGLTDFTYMSLDCFHLSQKGYALATNALWNNMLEPAGNKSKTWAKEFEIFKCPSAQRPFLATRANS